MNKFDIGRRKLKKGKEENFFVQRVCVKSEEKNCAPILFFPFISNSNSNSSSSRAHYYFFFCHNLVIIFVLLYFFFGYKFENVCLLFFFFLYRSVTHGLLKGFLHSTKQIIEIIAKRYNNTFFFTFD